MKTTEPKTTKQFTLTIDVESNRSADDTVTLFQRYFDSYQPSLKAKVRKQVTEKKAEAPAAEREDLL